MALDRDELRWNGWGRKSQSVDLTEVRRRRLLAHLGEKLATRVEPRSTAVPLEEAVLPESRLAAEARDALVAALGEADVRVSAAERATHAAGKSFPDLLRLRAGRVEAAPDAVVYPRSIEAVADVLRVARAHALAVVPFGGGTSVVGGVAPLRGPGQAAVVALDTTGLDRLLALDEVSGTATFQAGIDGPALEAALAARGYTLGHFPQSFEHSTLGGWIAARSSGQQSDGYGGIDALLVGARMITPEGEICTIDVPRNAAGPDLRELILGSEGILGVIVEATVRIHRAPAVRDIRGMLFRDFRAGTEAIRALAASGLPLMMMRLSDAMETALSTTLRDDPAVKIDPTRAFLEGARALGYGDERCLLLFGIDGHERARVRAQMLRAEAIGVRHGGLPLGRSPGKKWAQERFRSPYLRDFLLDHGVVIDTMETAFEWSRLDDAHDEVVAAMAAAAKAHAGAGLAMGHLSHSYDDGACVYFVLIYPLDDAKPMAQWQAIKAATTDAIVAAGGTVSHHHGVGVDHAPWLPREKGPLGMEVLRAVKGRLDPAGIMNPGKMI